MTISKVLLIERWQNEEDRLHFVQGLKSAGLPE
jgi:hypothetical protein